MQTVNPWPQARLVGTYTAADGTRLKGKVDVQMSTSISVTTPTGYATLPAGRIESAHLPLRADGENSFDVGIPANDAETNPSAWMMFVYISFTDQRDSETYYVASQAWHPGHRPIAEGSVVDIRSLPRLRSGSTVFPTSPGGVSSGVASVTKVVGGIRVEYTDGRVETIAVSEPSGDVSESLTLHVNDPEPHPAYDDMHDLTTIFNNTTR